MTKRISKTNVNFWLDAFLLCAFLVLCWSAVIVRYVFPPATKSAGWKLWRLDYTAWSDIQFATLCVLASGIMLHVMLHWTWVCGVVESSLRKRRRMSKGTKQDTSARTLWGVALLIVICNLVGLGIAAAVLSIQEPAL